ncbi:MAG: FAD-binding oxidoreductase [Rhizobiaceae bacterium]|nr:FAD-binding oxidoreductase [Rhizobiaceae bacterium]
MSSAHGSFGRTTPPTQRVLQAGEAIAALKGGATYPAMLLPYGNGRSYGDSCQNQDGLVVDMRSLDRIESFDPRTGLLVAQAGVQLAQIIDHAAPYGFFPAVVPGTKFVTLGGAIANDVHGKNHHRRGTFGCHVEAIELLRSDGKTYTCTRSSNARLLTATIGGMGLTGLILSATIRLMPVGSIDVVETVTPFGSLDAYFDRAEEADRDNEYAVAWIDQLAGGRAAGRGLLLTGNHAQRGQSVAPARAGGRSVPFQPPINVLNRPFLKAFNAAYRWSRSRNPAPQPASCEKFFFPLDGVRNWNRLYGPRGLFQHQSVIPLDAARHTVPVLLHAAREAGQGSFLTVLKRFGDLRSPGMISFPRPGYTLTLDFPNGGAATLALLSELDAITVAAGGGVNPYKDARMSAATFAATFPDWQRLENMRDPAFMSSFWSRTAMRLKLRDHAALKAAE